MELQLTGKRALITGSSSGLGEVIATVLAAEGATVVIHGRDLTRVRSVAAAVRAAGGRSEIAVGDLTSDDGADAVAEAALVEGPIDVLVNNVGIYDPSLRWTDLTATDWAQIYNVNVLSSVRLINRLVPDMQARGWGRVIQISSLTGWSPSASQPHYAAVNAARDNLATSLSRHVKGSGVTSNSVAAGGVLTPAVKQMIEGMGRASGWGETWEEIEPHAVTALMPNDVGRFGRPEDYAKVVAFLASPGAAYINGVSLRVDGGAYAVPA